VLSDVIMPELGGAELAQQLQHKFPGTPCILMTGYYAQAVPASFRGRILRKPFATEELLECVQAALQQQSELGPSGRADARSQTQGPGRTTTA
jgi:DNA-binding NtrC family response regulator